MLPCRAEVQERRVLVSDKEQVTNLLLAWQGGDEDALEELSPFVYRELHRLAGYAMAGESAGHTLQTTALVHEAFVRLFSADIEYEGRHHFFALAARMMRRILVDHARGRQRKKRGSGERPLPLAEDSQGAAVQLDSMLELDDALGRLTEFDSKLAETVELVYFGGLSYNDIATMRDTSKTAVFEDVRFAKAWLRKAMS